MEGKGKGGKGRDEKGMGGELRARGEEKRRHIYMY